MCAWVIGSPVQWFWSLQKKPAGFMRDIWIILICSGGTLLTAAQRPHGAPSPEEPPLLWDPLQPWSPDAPDGLIANENLYLSWGQGEITCLWSQRKNGRTLNLILLPRSSVLKYKTFPLSEGALWWYLQLLVVYVGKKLDSAIYNEKSRAVIVSSICPVLKITMLMCTNSL